MGFEPPQRPFILHRDKYWLWIREQAGSRNRFERVGALANAVGSLELAMIASGLNPKRRKSVSRTKYVGWPQKVELETAYLVRHQAVHNLKVPEPKDCRLHVGTFYEAWQALRRRFVTIENAAQLAKQFLARRHISGVFLFGSLARQWQKPRDIDLLIVDDGTLSWRWSRYGTVLVDSLLESAALSTKENRAAERSGWLDLLPVHAKLFGINRAYTKSVFRHQTDPFFFLNMADGVLAFNPVSGQWVDEVPLFFGHLAQVRKQLEHMSLVGAQRDGRVKTVTEESTALPPFAFDETWIDFDEFFADSDARDKS
jgi:predicted nucleotidyltransferase